VVIDRFEDGTMDSDSAPKCYFSVDTQNGISVVRLDDIQIGPDSREALYSLVENEGHKNVVLDLSEIWALSSLGLGVLANFQQKVEARDGVLKLCGLNPNLEQIFRMTKLDQIFSIHENQEKALRDFPRS
jgi:anti-anti-sigma factor